MYVSCIPISHNTGIRIRHNHCVLYVFNLLHIIKGYMYQAAVNDTMEQFIDMHGETLLWYETYLELFHLIYY